MSELGSRLVDQDCVIEQYKLALGDRDKEIDNMKRVSTNLVFLLLAMLAVVSRPLCPFYLIRDHLDDDEHWWRRYSPYTIVHGVFLNLKYTVT